MAFKKSQEFGISHTGLSYDFSKIIARSRGVADRVTKGVEYLMKKNKIEVISGTAKLIDKNSVEVMKDGVITDTIQIEEHHPCNWWKTAFYSRCHY